MKVRWTRLALQDLDSAFGFIAAENPRAARRLLGRMEAAVEALRSYPQMGQAGRVEGTRELIVSGSPFILAYRLARKRIEILALIHAARRWPEEF